MSTSDSRTCAGCGELKKLVRAHIVPESFCTLLARPKKAPLFVTSDKHPKRMPIGFYDTNILCSECEEKFSRSDDYGFSLLCQQKEMLEDVNHGYELVAQMIRRYDFAQLKLFVLSVLWRAGVSKLEFYEHVQLGVHEARLREVTLYGSSCGEDEYSFVAGRLVGRSQGDLMPAPFLERFEGVNYWRIYIGEFHFWVKVDRRPTPAVFREVIAKIGQPLPIICRDIIGSAEHVGAQNIVRMQKLRSLSKVH